MAVSGRTSKVSSVIATLCIVVYIAAVGLGVVRVIIDIGERRNLANREFQDLANRATSAAVFHGFMSQGYQETITDFLGYSRTLMGAIISSSGGDFAFERFPGSGIVRIGNTPRFQTRIDFPRQPLFLPLRVDGQAHVSIQATYSAINAAFLLVVLRDTLFAVLIALAVAFITLLVELTQKSRYNYQPAATHAETQAEPELSQDFPPLDEVYTEPSPTADLVDDPHGLFTPRANIGWESYTRDRLASELHRCASFEQDLVFLVMEFKNRQVISDSMYRQFADETVAFFTMRDLIFEMGEKGISIIIPSMDLEQGMTKAEEFHSRYNGREKLHIGLSSRSGRLIEAERLMMEATSALEKTQEEPGSHIIAFKSDPEKYRNFIKSRS